MVNSCIINVTADFIFYVILVCVVDGFALFFLARLEGQHSENFTFIVS